MIHRSSSCEVTHLLALFQFTSLTNFICTMRHVSPADQLYSSTKVFHSFLISCSVCINYQVRLIQLIPFICFVGKKEVYLMFTMMIKKVLSKYTIFGRICYDAQNKTLDFYCNFSSDAIQTIDTCLMLNTNIRVVLFQSEFYIVNKERENVAEE